VALHRSVFLARRIANRGEGVALGCGSAASPAFAGKGPLGIGLALVELHDAHGSLGRGVHAEVAEHALVEVRADDLDAALAALKMSTGQTSSSFAASSASAATEPSTSTSMKTASSPCWDPDGPG